MSSLITEYRTAKTEEEAFEIGASFKRHFPPQGYDSRAMYWRNSEGTWTVKLERFSSCD